MPNNAVPTDIAEEKCVRTLAGPLKSQQVITMRDLRVPKFDKNRCINQQKCLLFGTNFLKKAGIVLDYDKEEMRWYACALPLRPKNGLNSKEFDAIEDSLFIQVEDELFGEDWIKCFATCILDA